jgi:Ran GTPase-activating protein 1
MIGLKAPNIYPYPPFFNKPLHNLPYSFFNMAPPAEFSLAGKSLKLDTAEDIAPHIQPLQLLESVQSVDLSGNTLGVGASEALAKVLSTKKSLTSANLADIFTSRLLSEIPPALDVLLKALLTLPNLHTVDLSDNAFGLNTCDPLVVFLSAHTPLEHLYLNNNGLGPIAGSKIANALTTLAEKKREAGAKPLRTVVCGRNRLENGSMASWAKAYSLHTGVTHIRMVQNGIRQEGITALLKNGLRNVPGIQVLELEDNTFTAMGCKALSDIVSGWTDLKVLNLNDCYLGARGFTMFGESLRGGKNKSLEIMKLQYNNINSKGVQLLADIHQFLPALRKLELNGNKFSEDEVSVERLREIFEERKDTAGADEDDEEWGLDELDELESEDEDEDEEEAEEEEEEHEEVLKRADEAETENVSQKESKDVDKLADMLGKTGI